MKRILRSLCAVALLCFVLDAVAQYPTRPIRVIVPFPAGGSIDVVSRLVALKLQERLGQPVIVDNRPGATGNIGAEAVARSAPDGHTLLFSVAAITVNPWFQAVPFDLVRDLAPVTQLTRAAFVLVVNPRNSMNSLDDMIAQAKKQPGKLNYGSFGIGSGSHLAMAMLEDAAGVSLTHVSYKGLAPMQLALLAGEIDVAFDTAVNVVRQVKAGRLRALAVTSPSEAEGLAGVPSLVSRYPDFNADGWQGVWVPAGTPRPVIERLQGEISAILKTPEIIQKFRELSSEPVGNSAKDFDTFVRAELARWGKLIREMNIKGE